MLKDQIVLLGNGIHEEQEMREELLDRNVQRDVELKLKSEISSLKNRTDESILKVSHLTESVTFLND